MVLADYRTIQFRTDAAEQEAVIERFQDERQAQQREMPDSWTPSMTSWMLAAVRPLCCRR